MAGSPQQTSELEKLRHKKFKVAELPLSVSQRAAVDNLLYLFKKKGGFDLARKKIWAGFNESVLISNPKLSLLGLTENGHAGY